MWNRYGYGVMRTGLTGKEKEERRERRERRRKIKKEMDSWN
jgi:hypothetical protein